MKGENTITIQKLVSSVRVSLGILLLMVLIPKDGISQNSSQVSITGIPSILPTPFADDLENNFINGQYQISFTYTSQFNQPVDFIFDFVVRKDGRAIIDLQSEPRAFTPGTYVFINFFEELIFPQTSNDVLRGLPRDIQNQLVQTGVIPEGRYTIEIEARPARAGQISVIPGIANFSVRYPPPPRLVSPSRGSNVTLDVPVFSWTPVVALRGRQIAYDFLLVEVFEGQTPLQAISGNRAIAEETLINETTLPYTIQFLPLEPGRQYAWQVTANDAIQEIPFQSDGESEIYTFTYKEVIEQPVEELTDLEQIILVQDFARIVDFEMAEIIETEQTYLLNGSATLDLDFNTLGNVKLSANLQGLEIQKQNLDNPVLVGGSLSAIADNLELLLGGALDFSVIDEISWSLASGLTAELSIDVPGIDFADISGNVSIEPDGFYGVVSAEGSPLVSITHQLFIVDVFAITAEFPDGQIRTRSQASLFGDPVCDVSEMPLFKDNFRVKLECDVDRIMPMVQESENLLLDLKSIDGLIEGNWDGSDLIFNAQIDTDISLMLTSDRQCGASTTINISSEDGVRADGFMPNCDIPKPKLDLGFLKATVDNLAINNIGLNEEEDGLEYEVEFDTQISFPNNPDLMLPRMDGITISNDGIDFPSIEFNEEQIPVINTFSIADFELALERFQLEDFTFPWFDWDGTGIGPWSFSFDAGMSLPYAAHLPGCFSASELFIENASVAGDGVSDVMISGAVSSRDVASCSWNIGPGFGMDIHFFAGQVSIQKQDEEYSVSTAFEIDADFFVDSPFMCGSEPVIELDEFTISLEEGLQGEISNIGQECQVNIGPFTAEITDASLLFDYNTDNGQSVILDAQAQLQLEGAPNTAGTFSFDFTTGQFLELEFDIEGPFEWGIPEENPLLVFTLEQAILNLDGFFVDGRQSVQVGEQQIGTTFDEVLLDWQNFRVAEGRIIFDSSFSFMAGYDADINNLVFTSATTSDPLNLNPGVLLELAGTVQIDSLGLRSSGSASASLFIEDMELDELTIEYTDDFAIQLNPLQVTSGQADFIWGTNSVAYVNNSGFYPNLSFFAEELLPARIPLPHETVAYLQIRDELTDEILVNTTQLDNGTYLIETMEGHSLNMVVPALQGDDEANPPTIEVVLDDLVVNPLNGSFLSGSVFANVTGDSPFANRPNIPLDLKRIFFARGYNNAGQEIKALFLSGNITAFDTVLGGDENEVNLYIDSSGLLKGGVVLPDLNAEIPLDGPGGRVALVADSLSGTFQWNPQAPASSSFSLNFDGGFQINDYDGSRIVRADLGFDYNEFGISVRDFNPGDLLDYIPLNFGPLSFNIPSVNLLSISYSEDTGFDYYAGLDLEIGIDISGETVEIPLNDIEIRSDTGFHFPAHNLDLGEIPGLNLPTFDFEVFQIEPLALRISEFNLNWNDWTPGDLLGLIPSLDFALSFPQFSSSAPEISALSLTLQDVAFDQGVLSGDILPFDASSLDIFMPIGSGAGINLQTLGGSLFEDEGSQRFSILFEGEFEMPEFFTTIDNPCPKPAVSVELVQSTKIEGIITDIQPCGRLGLGPVEVGFGQSDIEFSVAEDEQMATLSGSAEAYIQTDEGMDLEASGSLELNLLTGRILDGSLAISTEFPWNFPRANPFLEFRVESAEINEQGLVFNAGGSLIMGDGSADVSFNQMTFDIPTAELVDGSVEIINNFAFDVAFGPTDWSVVDPANDPEFDQGVRFVIPENAVIDASGLLVTGQSGASLYFGEEEHDQLIVDFVDTRFNFDPTPSVTDGRADIILNDEGEGPIRLGWFDSDGFHPDNILAAVPLPDILPLPHEDIAYLQLTDGEGNNLVQSENVGEGLSISSIEPVPIIITAFEKDDGSHYSVNVTFEDIVINSSLEMVSGIIAVDLEDTPLNLNEETDFPFSLTRLEYRRESGTNRLYSNARLTLPGELEELVVMAEDLVLGPDGFEEVTIALGEYTDEYDPDNEAVIVEHEFADGAFDIALRGAELTFGSEMSYKVSGDITSGLLRNDDDDKAIVHLAVNYIDGTWAFFAETSHLVPHTLPIASAEIILDGIAADMDDDHFAIVLDGRFVMPEIVGNDMEIGIEGLSIGTAGISLEQIDLSAFTGETLSLFGQEDILTIGGLTLELTDDYHLLATLNGVFNFLDRDITISGFQIGTNGTFVVEGGDVNLLTNDIELLGENLTLTTLQIGVNNNVAQLTALADLTLPEPVETNSEVGITITHEGEVSVQQPDINFAGVAYDIPEIGSFSLDGVEFELRDINEADFGIYAWANMNFDSAVNGKIEFGSSREEWGLKYETGGSLEWRVTELPGFTFENEMFYFSITPGIGEARDDEFGVYINVSAALTLDGIGGSIGFNNMLITTSGIEEIGDFQNATLYLGSDDDSGPISLSLSEFEYARDGGTLILEEAGGNIDDEEMQRDPEVIEVEIPTLRHLIFGGNITVPGFSGGVDEVLYYETVDQTYLSIKDANLKLSDQASLTASLEFQSFGGGDFSLFVAGSAQFSPPGGATYGLAALGKMEQIGDHFSFGIFVKLDAEIVILPGILSLTSFGGGFFYNAEPNDFQNVLDLADYDITNPKPPWEEEEDGYDFAIIIYAGAGLIGSTGNFVVDAEAFIFLTPSWLAIDLDAKVFDDTPAEIHGGMYLVLQWSPHVMFEGGFNAELVGPAPLVTGDFYFNFMIVRESTDEGSETIWAVNGGVNDLNVLRILRFDGSFIAGNNGFYFQLGVTYEFDVKLVSASASLDLEFWWIFGEQLGAYIEFSVEIRMFKGAFKGGGDFAGALIIDNGYLVYATATVWVEVRFVYTGYTTGYVAVRDGRYSAGRGASDEYEHLIAEAREDAQNMNSSLSEALAAAQDIMDVVELDRMSDEDLAAAGEAILGSNWYRLFAFLGMLQREGQLTGSTPNLFESINSAMNEIDNAPRRSDYNINSRRQAMNSSLDALGAITETVHDDLSAIEANAIEWEAESAELLDAIMNNPVQSRTLEWGGTNGNGMPTSAPDFQINEDVDQANRESLESHIEDIEAMREQFQSAMQAIVGNIQMLENALTDEGTNINEISNSFSSALTDTERFYGSMGALYWDINRWALISRSVYQDVDFDMEQAVANAAEGMLADIGITMNYDIQNPQSGSHYSFDEIHISGQFCDQSINQTYTDAVYESFTLPSFLACSNEIRDSFYATILDDYDFSTLIDIATDRRAILYYFYDEDEDYNSVKDTDVSNFEGYLEDRNFNQFFVNWVLRAVEFWYSMPTLGYEELLETSELRAEAFYSEFDNSDSPVAALMYSYEEFTNSVDNIYSVKHSMHVTLEEVIRQYIDWQEDLDGEESVPQTHYNILEQIRSHSLPPNITSVTSSSDFDGYLNEFTLSWNATHQSGGAIESSYYISTDNYNSNIYRDNFITVGNNTSVTRYLTKRVRNENNRNLTVRVRARGPSGLSITRLFTTSLGLNPAPMSYDSPFLASITGTLGESYTDYTGLLTPPPDPPDAPTIEFPSYYQNNYTRVIPRPHGLSLIVPFTEYWSNDPDMIEFTAQSFDDVHDIAEFEFKIGTFDDRSSIMDWTKQSGVPVVGSASNYQRYNVHGIDLEMGEEYFVTVRAINGAGAVSEESSYGPIKIDEERPSRPLPLIGPVDSIVQFTTSKAGTEDIVHGAVFENFNIYEGLFITQPEDPKITLRWSPSSDPHSGLRHYIVAASTSSDVDFALEHGDVRHVEVNNKIVSYTFEGGSLNYSDEFYFHIVAEDNTGNLSDPLTLGPVQINDRTSPTTPVIVARPNKSKIGFYIRRPATDSETGVDHYYYEIVRRWSGTVYASGELPVYIPVGLHSPPYIELPTEGVPVGEPLKIRVAAVNGQGEKSRFGISYIIRHDKTPPKMPVVAASQNGSDIDIDISNIHDPESGVVAVDYRVRDISGNVLQGWQNVYSSTGIMINLSRSTTYTTSGGVAMSSHRIDVRVRNKNGKVTTSDAVAPVLQFVTPAQEEVQNAQINVGNPQIDLDINVYGPGTYPGSVPMDGIPPLGPPGTTMPPGF